MKRWVNLKYLQFNLKVMAKILSFTAYAMIDGTRKKVVIKAASLENARRRFAEKYPGCPVPDLK